MIAECYSFDRDLISPNAIRETLTHLINEFIRIEKTLSGLEYQQSSSSVRGQINLITSFIREEIAPNESYYEHLKNLVNTYSLQGVWRVEDLKVQKHQAERSMKKRNS